MSLDDFAPPDPDADVFQRLRALRKRTADEERVPAYVVFSDAVLRHMAQMLPRTRAELLRIPGIGPVKLDRYGDAFLQVLRDEARNTRSGEARPDSEGP